MAALLTLHEPRMDTYAEQSCSAYPTASVRRSHVHLDAVSTLLGSPWSVLASSRVADCAAASLLDELLLWPFETVLGDTEKPCARRATRKQDSTKALANWRNRDRLNLG